jgi:hypothetical protein
MALTIQLEFDPRDASHRRVAEWLAAQPDPAEAVVRLVRAASEGDRRLSQWEELATLLANEVRKMRAQLAGRPPEVREDPESAQRLDSMFG